MIYTSIILLPNRIDGFKQLLQELPKYSIDFLYIHLCKFYTRLNMSFPIPELIELYQALDNFPVKYRILTHANDIGPCLKIYGLLPEIDVITDKNNHVLLLDDDTIHHPSIIKQLCSYNPQNCVAGCMGVNAPNFIHGEYLDLETEVRVLGGYRGILYPTEIISKLKPLFKNFVDEIVNVYRQELNTIPLHDDHIFASFFRKNGIPLKVIALHFDSNNNQIPYRILNNSNGIFQVNSNDKQLALLELFLTQRGYQYN